MKITLFGTGYVGLVTGTCFAEAGNHVLCVGIYAKKSQILTKELFQFYKYTSEII